MIEIGTEINIIVSEPWDSDKVINGIIIRSLNSDNIWVIRENETNQLYTIQCRYSIEKLSDILTMSIVNVGISIPLSELDLLTIPEIKPDVYKWLNYVYIGGMQLMTNA
jgi:hypothetical protein